MRNQKIFKIQINNKHLSEKFIILITIITKCIIFS